MSPMKNRISQFVMVALVACAFAAPAVAEGEEPGANPERRRRPARGRLLKRFDQNGDGALAKAEVPERLWERLSQADSNGDGVVTKDEVKARLKDRKGRKGKRREGAMRRFDKDGDGILSNAEKAEAKGARGKRGGKRGRAGGKRRGRKAGRAFKRFDKNTDGALTADEVPAELWERISKADADGNGSVTKDEIKAAIKARRAARKDKAPDTPGSDG